MVRIKSLYGFTLVEILLSMMFLSIMVAGITSLYISGFVSLDTQEEQMLFDSALRSRMEWLVSQKFKALADGSEIVTIAGVDHTITWTVEPVDLNGDTFPEPTAVKVAVTGMQRSLTTLVVDPEGLVGKLP